VAEYRQRTVQGFRRVAVLVSTTAGQLQVQRHIDEEKLKTARVFVDWEEALVWLRQTPSRLP
ncbi:MAG TPA: hypothetical protein VFQ61_06710, partial [Polyangiaceae bacterium]|nr:hypothetical protein [Polyangiaceae bacterium]